MSTGCWETLAPSVQVTATQPDLLELVPVQVKELRSAGEVVVKRGLQQNRYCLGMVVVEGEV